MQNKDEYYLGKAFEMAEKSICCRRRIGSIVVKDDKIVCEGYNTVLENFPNCDELGCIREQLKIESGTQRDICHALCAEQYAITKCAKLGIPLEGATIYINTSPCSFCTKLIVASGIKKVVVGEEYSDMSSIEIFKKANIEYKKIDIKL